MIISPPFLPEFNSDDAVFVQNAMPDSPDLAPSSGGAPLGSYPLTTALTWHNGLHIKAPLGPDNKPLPVRAIADGTVIFKHEPRPKNSTASDPQNYNPYGNTPAWTDNGMVIIRHKTDIGATGLNPTTVTYYSVYMHLARIESVIAIDKPIWRKDLIGKAGHILGGDNQIHFEICLDAAGLQKLLGRTRSIAWSDPTQAPTSNGRTDALFGSIYVYLPAGTPTSSIEPKNHLAAPLSGASAATDHFLPNTLRSAQWVEIRYQDGSGVERSYRAVGSGAGACSVGDPIGDPKNEPDFEYNLHREASRRHESLDTAAQAFSSPSGWYELLRFGRLLGQDLLPANASHWRAIPTEASTIWADLNAPGTFKFSDADFPAFKGWQCFDDDDTHENQRCDSVELRRVLRDPLVPESIRERSALASRLGHANIREAFKRAICKFPTEWDKTTILARYRWLKVDEDFKIEEGKEWDEFQAHCESISFEALPKEYTDAVWHLHPRTFIQHMRRCEWLSVSEFAQCIPRESLKGKVSWDDASRRAQIYSIPYNTFIRTFSSGSRFRYAHNLAQSMLEVDLFATLTEYGKGKNHPYEAFYGRGFHQITWAGNFAKYGEFKKFPANTSGTYSDPRITRTSRHQVADGGKLIQWYPRYDPSSVERDVYQAAAASGYYWISKHFRGTSNINRVCDSGVSGSTVGFISWLVNGGSNGYAERQQISVHLSNVLLDEAPVGGIETYTYPVLGPSLTKAFPIARSLPHILSGTINHVRQVP